MRISDQKKLKDQFTKACQKKTSSARKNWSAENPTWGHCAVVALTVQDIYGGDIVRVTYKTRDGVSGSHYFNIMPDTSRLDLTFDQFPPGTEFQPKNPWFMSNSELLKHTDDYLKSKGFRGTVRAYMLGHKDTKKRYKAYTRTLKNKTSAYTDTAKMRIT